MVLLDGDGVIFQDHYLQNGEQGGKDAANQLWAALTHYVARNFPNISSPKIVTRIYANVKGLGVTCHHAGITDSPSVIDDFVRGFNKSRLLFDFVDVGSGKGSADDKISGKVTILRGLISAGSRILRNGTFSWTSLLRNETYWQNICTSRAV
jgi:hypothetical protein